MQPNNSENKIWFLGRGFEEYLQMFNLRLNYLRECKILDCNAGASSFAAHMTQQGFDVVAADILYSKHPEEMKKVSENDFRTLMDAHHGLQDKVDWGFFEDHEQMAQYRIKTYKDFSKDYEKNKDTNYVEAKLPMLPFHDNTFHLVLSSHLLFLYDDRLDYDFHLESIKEMIRVSSQEVRIYPLVQLRNSKKSEYVEQIINDLSPDFSLEVHKVDYKFRPGADEMLCISKKPWTKSSCGLYTLDAIEVEGK
ncbi:class I SAM-dependent methyltransferase [Methanobacterium alcaliphilum]|uniref:class I SAM-dependent methyltransferase n=1 Tax=Methanobacterium alcaliphilum TaxID=392018 RepID=UPI00200AB3D3|nr:class I SAM-dependent methyltransferase [Methanobacterium alcaliphilum]MCK9150513.1 class I SAM-dependent methyltransferase [Methanobacterium alcaliphilum]